jgi:formamidopyrimidine-DNA glycosylase
MVKINVGGIFLHFGDGVNLRYYAAGEIVPEKHQLFVAFEDGSVLVGTVAIYGGLWCFEDGAFNDNVYYKASKE